MLFHIWKSTILAKTWRRNHVQFESHLYPLFDETPKPKLSYSPSLLVVSLSPQNGQILTVWTFLHCRHVMFFDQRIWSLFRQFLVENHDQIFYGIVEYNVLLVCGDRLWLKMEIHYSDKRMKYETITYLLLELGSKILDLLHDIYYWLSIQKKILLHILHSFFSIYMSKSFWLNSILWKKTSHSNFSCQNINVENNNS